jgi:hypothetical protein
MTMDDKLLDKLIEDLGMKKLPLVESVEGEVLGFGKELVLDVKLRKYPSEGELKMLQNGILGTIDNFLEVANENIKLWTCGILVDGRRIDVIVQGDHFLE